MKTKIYLSIILVFGLCINVIAQTNYLLNPANSNGIISVIAPSSNGNNASVAVAYSVRQLKSSYDHAAIIPPSAVAGFSNSTTPLLRVQRSTDHAQLDIGYDAKGNLDTVILKNFVTSNNVNPLAHGRVTVWYDQSGNSRDAFAPDTARRLYIVTNGVIERNLGQQIGVVGRSGGMLEHRPTATTTFNGGTGGNIYGISADRTLNVVSQPRVYNGTGVASDGGGTYLIDRYGDPNTSNGGTPSGIDQPLTSLKAIGTKWALQIRLQDGTGINNSIAGTVDISTSRSDNVTVTRTGDKYALFVNGSFAGSNTLTGYNPMSPVRIGYGSNTSEQVYYGEFILFPSSLPSQDLAALNANQSNYFVLGTPSNSWTGALNTSWTNTGNWGSNQVPDVLTPVTISSGRANYPVITSSVSVKSIKVETGATLTINNGGTLNVQDSFTINGTLAGAGTGTVNLDGGLKQYISGSGTIAFRNLTISNTNDTAVINNSINVAGTLTVNSNAVLEPLPSAVINNAAAQGTITGNGTVLVTRISATANYQNQYKFSTNTLTNLTLNYAGLGDQSITLSTNHGNIIVSGTGTKTFSAAVTTTNVTGNVSLLSGTLSNGGFAIAGNSGKTLSAASGATLLLTASTFPTGFGTFTFDANSTVNYASTNTQTIAAVNYGNLVSSNTGARTLASSGTIGIAGTFTAGTNSYTTTSSTVNYNGTAAQSIVALNYNNLTISGNKNNNAVTFATGVVGIAGTATFSATNTSWIVTGNTIDFNGAAQTIPTTFTYNNLTYSGSGNKTGTANVNGIFSLEGTAVVSSAISYGNDATVQFNRTSNYTLPNNNALPATFSGSGGVIIKNTGVITLNAAKTIDYSLSIETGAKINLSTYTAHTTGSIILGGVLQTATGSYGYSGANNNNTTYFANASGRIAVSTKIWDGSSSTDWNVAANWTPSGVPAASNSVIIPSSPSRQPFITSANATCLNLTLENGSVLSFENNRILTITGSFVNEGGTVNGTAGTIALSGGNRSIAGVSTTFSTLSIGSGTAVTLSGNHTAASLVFAGGANGGSLTHLDSSSLTISGAVTINQPTGNVSNSWNINEGSVTVNGLISFEGTNTNTGRVQEIVITSGTLSANGGITFANTNNTSRRIVMSGGRLNIAGALTLNGRQTLTATNSTINFNGSTAQTVPFFYSGAYNNLEFNNTNTATLSAAITTSNVTGNITVNSGTLNNGGYAIAGNSSAIFAVNNGATFVLSGTSAFPTGFGTTLLQENSTINYAGTSTQTILAKNYGNLVSSSTGARTLDNSATIGIAGTFTKGTNSYTTTGSSINYNGTNSQTVVAFNYNNLVSSSTGARTLDNTDTVRIAGAFVAGTNEYTVEGSTVKYTSASGSQNIAGFTYDNLTLNNTSGTNVAVGNIKVDGALTIASGGTLNLEANTLGGALTTIANNGTIQTTATETPLPTGKTWGGKVYCANTEGNQTIVAGTYNELQVGNKSTSNNINGNIVVNGALIFNENKIQIGSNTLTINGTISNHNPAACFVANGSSNLVINGTGALGSNIFFDQTNDGITNRIQNLTINRAAQTIVLGSPLQVKGTVIPTSGTLATNGNLTLVSDVTGTARIAAIPAGSDVTGNVISQRYVPAVTRRYRTISPNTQSFVFNDLKDDIFVTGTGGAANGFDVSPTNGATIYTYQESTTGGRGWKAISSTSQSLAAGQGALVFVRGDRTLANWYTAPFPNQNEVVIDFNGAINKGTISPSLSYTNTGIPGNDGWNLIGNPYPSPIDWNLVTKSGISSFIYHFDPATNGYITDDGSTPIASGQAFFVQANTASPSVTFTEACKTSGTPISYFKAGSTKLTIKMVKDSLNSDVAWLRFKVNTSTSYNAQEDAIKFANSGINMGYLVPMDAVKVQLNTVPPLTNTADTFAMFANAASGTYTMEFNDLQSVPSTKAILWVDRFTNTITDVRTTSTYAFSITSDTNSYGNRFKLIITDYSSLPVEFITVNASTSNNDIVIKWNTASEMNNHHFVVEKSYDNKEFDEVGNMQGKGNTKFVSNYLFNDKNGVSTALQNGFNKVYYRIKQVDVSGKSAYSNVVVVSLPDLTSNIQHLIYPNPSTGVVFFETNTTERIEVIDITGKTVKVLNAINGKNKFDLSDLKSGIYYLHSENTNLKLIINN